MSGNLFCFGFGYTAAALARRLRPQGWTISGSTRSAESAERLSREGYEPVIFDGAGTADLYDGLSAAGYILISIPPGEAGDPVLVGASHALAEVVSPCRWLGYLSTTGVYGNRHGGWVDESTPPAPASPRAVRRLAAEREWQKFAQAANVPLHIFRLPGIYGPGRSAIDALRAGRARRIEKPGQIFSRIHVDDLAAVLEASMSEPSPGALFNVCDDEPAPQADVVAYAARLLGLPLPPLESFDAAAPSLSDMAKSFYEESRSVRNDAIKRILGVRLRFPTYREGLAAIARGTG